MRKIKIFSLRVTFLFLIIFLNYLQFSVAQTINSQEIKFRHITGDDGLSQNYVSAILQDSKGFMWFGTKDGLNRYDGYSFVIYQHNPFDTTTISDNYITALFEDSRGYIWIGTANGGLNCFERGTETFHHIRYSSVVPDRAFRDEIKSIAEDPKGNIWIGTRGEGIYKFSFKGKNSFELNYKQYINEPENPGSLSSNVVYELYIDSQEILWVGTKNGLNEFNFENESIKSFKLQILNSEFLSRNYTNNVTSIYESNEGDFWLGTITGLVRFNRTSGEYKSFPHELIRGWGSISQIDEDFSGKLWLATSGELMRFNPATLSYDYYKNDPLNQQSISYNHVTSLCIDDTGILWVGTAGLGINLYDPKANRFSTLVIKRDPLSRAKDFSVRSVLKDDNGFIWINADILYRWNSKTGVIKSFESSTDNLDGFGIIFSMIQASDGIIWFASSEGFYKYNPSSEDIKHYKYDPVDSTGLTQKEVYAVFQDKQGSIWIASDRFFSRLINIEKGIFQHFRYQATLPYNQQGHPVIYQDNKGKYWIGTQNGLMRFNLEKKSFFTYKNDPEKKNSLDNNFIKSICPDPNEPDNILWLGTAGGGLNRFNMEEGTFSYFTEKDGLPNNVVYGILPDEKGNLWLSTNKGLSKFNPQDSIFRNYDVNDGLQSNEFNTGAYFRSKDGELFFGGIKGLNYFYPDKIIDNPNIPRVVLTNIKLGDKYVTTKSKNSVLQKTISEADKIVLPYDEDVITFEFAALDYSAPEKNRYAYKLENFNSNWIYSGSIRSATYIGLPPGEYIFHVKASNNDGVWNDKGVTLSLIITPPWWQTWWAYILYGLLFLAGLYILRRYELNRMNLKNQLKIEKVESDSLRNLDQMKSHFFANISHEFRTPLTLILGHIESVLSSDSVDKIKGKLLVANVNAKRLLALINQLLDLSKLESGGMKILATQIDLIPFLKNIFFSFESLAEKKEVLLQFNTELSKLEMCFDREKMEKIFLNLVSNAIKFSNEGGIVKIFVELNNEDDENPKALITVSDNGVGIPEDQQDHIFDRFYQVDSSQTRSHEGTGIGLALVKELVELHKGKISVKSKVDEGTVFTIELPAGKSHLNSSEIVPDNETRENQSATDLYITSESEYEIQDQEESIIEDGYEAENDREIILIVEDNKDIRTYIKDQLEENYKIIEAADGEAGLAAAKETIPDLIVTDVMMPQMDGYEFAKNIRGDERSSHIPIIMLTARAADEDKISGLETGVDDYLIKPFNPKELQVRIKNLLEMRSLLRKRFSKALVIKPEEVSVIPADKKFMEKLISEIDKNLQEEDFTTAKLSNTMGMSMRTLSRKLNSLIDQSPSNLIRSMRLNRAAELLKKKVGNIAEVAYQVGFSDQAHFTRAFKKEFDLSPSDYAKKHS